MLDDREGICEDCGGFLRLDCNGYLVCDACGTVINPITMEKENYMD